MISWVMLTQKMRMEDAYKFVASKRAIICPNSSFRKQLEDYDAELFGKRPNRSGTLRSFLNIFSKKEAKQ